MLQRRSDVDLREKSLGAEHRRQLGEDYFYGDLSPVSDILSQVNGRHSTFAKLAIENVAIGQGGGEPLNGVCHGLQCGALRAPSQDEIRARPADSRGRRRLIILRPPRIGENHEH